MDKKQTLPTVQRDIRLFVVSQGSQQPAKKHNQQQAAHQSRGAAAEQQEAGGQTVPTADASHSSILDASAGAAPATAGPADEQQAAAGTEHPLQQMQGQGAADGAAGQQGMAAPAAEVEQQQQQQQDAELFSGPSMEQQNQPGKQRASSRDDGAAGDGVNVVAGGSGTNDGAVVAAAGAVAAAGGGSGSLTAYELERMQRIRRNQEVMLNMGLGGPSIPPKPKPVPKPAAPKPARKRPLPAEQGGAAAAVRRSGRNRGPPAGGASMGEVATVAAAVAEAEDASAAAQEPELQYDDSSVRRYICEVLTAGSGSSTAGSAGGGSRDVPDGARVSGFRQLPGCLHSQALTRAYSVDARPGLVVAGGKDGVVAVWGSRQLEAGALPAHEAEAPLLAHKLHKGWVSDVQFVGGGAGDSAACDPDSLLLLTAGNDGAVCLWDLCWAAGTGRGSGGGGSLLPRCLARATDLHSDGIFSLHEYGGRVLTASKDCTVAISSLGGTASLAAVQQYDELHTGVVKCARWRDADTFASCGNDRLCVVDARQPPSAGASLAVEGAHSSAINCLRWHPTNQHLVLSASYDPAILLHDLRRPAEPLHRFAGHAQAARVNAIYQPAFCAGGDAIATSCERSTLLSLYCTRTGATISRGDTGLTVGATFCGRSRGDPLLCTAARSVHLFAPTWHTALHKLSL